MRLAGSDDVILGLLGLEHAPHGVDEVGGVAPVALGVEIADVQPVLVTVPNPCRRQRDLAGDEVLAPARRLVVEQDTVDREQPVGLPVVPGKMERKDLGSRVRAPRIKWRGLVLRGLEDLAEHLRGRRLVEARIQTQASDRLQDPHRAHGVDIDGVLGNLERHLDVRLRRQVVDLLGLKLLQHAVQRGPVLEIAVHQVKTGVVGVGELMQMIDTSALQARGSAHDTPDVIALG